MHHVPVFPLVAATVGEQSDSSWRLENLLHPHPQGPPDQLLGDRAQPSQLHGMPLRGGKLSRALGNDDKKLVFDFLG